MKGTRILRICCLLVGYFGMIVIGVIGGFNVYANAVKKTFDYTQSEVELIASLGNIGEYFGIPAGFFFSRFGPRWTSVIGLILTNTGFLLLWMAVKLKHIFKFYSGLVAFFYFIGAHGAVYLYMAALMTNIENFKVSHRGKVVASLDAMYCASPSIFAAVYTGLFIQGHTEDAGNQRLEDYYILITVCMAVANILGMFFFRAYPEELSIVTIRQAQHANENSSETAPLLQDSDPSTANSSVTNGNNSSFMYTGSIRTISICELLRNWNIQYGTWMQAFALGVSIMYSNNITAVLHSLHLNQYIMLFTVILPIIGVVVSFAICAISDHFSERLPRSIILLVLNIMLTASQFFLIFYVDDFAILVAASILESVAASTIFSLGATLLSEKLSNNFDRVWSIVMILMALCGFAMQKVFGAIYDSYIDTSLQTDCIGAHCFTWIFVASSGVCVCSSILNIGLIEGGW